MQNPKEFLDAKRICVAVGEKHSFVVSDTGQLWGSGENSSGQLGLAFILKTDCFARIPLPEACGSILEVAVGAVHTLIRDDKGALYVTGAQSQNYGQVGLGEKIGSRSFTCLSDMGNVISIAAGKHHSLVVTKGGNVWVSGRNSWGQLGLQVVESTPFSTITMKSREPDQNKFKKVPELKDIVRVVASEEASFALSRFGRVFSCGSGGDGQLGHGDCESEDSFKEVVGLTDIVEIVAGGHTVFALNQKGKLFSWGHNRKGEAGREPCHLREGDMSSEESMPPECAKIVEVVMPSECGKIVAISMGASHCFVLDEHGQLFTCGWNRCGQLGLDNFSCEGENEQPTFTRVKGLPKIVAMSAGPNSSLVVDEEGCVWGCGSNQCGELGFQEKYIHEFQKISNICLKQTGSKEVPLPSLLTAYSNLKQESTLNPPQSDKAQKSSLSGPA